MGFTCTKCDPTAITGNWTAAASATYKVPGQSVEVSPVPNPEMLQEFKVQTELYDAAFGRSAAGNVSVISKGARTTIMRQDRTPLVATGHFHIQPEWFKGTLRSEL
jgi:hypothetical protein